MRRVEDSTTNTAEEIGVGLFLGLTLHDVEGFSDEQKAELAARHLAHGRRERRAVRANRAQIKSPVSR